MSRPRPLASAEAPDRLPPPPGADLAAGLRRRRLALGLRLGAPRVHAVIERVKRERLSYLDRASLVDLALAVRALEAEGVEGQLIEAGCALGGSALVMAAAKASSRAFMVYDTFETIPPPSAADGADVIERYSEISAGRASGIGGDPYYGYQGDLRPRVAARFEAFGLPLEANAVRLIKGLYADKLHPTGPVALAHVDCDWYDSVRVCLERIVPWLVPGGRLIFDDYDHWSGGRQAVDDFFRGRDGFRFERHTRLQVLRALRAGSSSSSA